MINHIFKYEAKDQLNRRCVCVRTCVATVDKVYWFVEKSDKNSDFTSHWGGDA